MTELLAVLALFVCLGVPLIGISLLNRAEPGKARPFSMGILSFIISQVLIRMPLMNLLSTSSPGFMLLSATSPVVIALIQGLSAAVFESAARLLFLRYALKDHRSYYDGIAFGLGHGGIEAMLFTGISCIAVLFAPSDTFSPIILAYAAAERLMAIALHVTLSLLLRYGINEEKMGRYLLLIIGIHAILDSLIGYLGAIGINTGLVELTLLIMVLPLSYIGWRIRRRFQSPVLCTENQAEVTEEP